MTARKSAGVENTNTEKGIQHSTHYHPTPLYTESLQTPSALQLKHITAGYIAGRNPWSVGPFFPVAFPGTDSTLPTVRRRNGGTPRQVTPITPVRATPTGSLLIPDII